VTGALLMVLAVQAPATATVQGEVRSAGERTPVAGAKIFVSPRRDPTWTRATVSTSDGRFQFVDLPTARELVLTIVAPGHERFEQPTPAKFWSGRRQPVIYVQPNGASQYRTVVAARRDERLTPTRTRLAPEEAATLPGSQGDPLRALQNLPGMARIPGGLGLLVLRGASPNQSQVFLGEHPIPRAFHFPGLASVVQGGVLSGIDYVPGNFDSSRGNAVGGIVTLTPRVGRRDGLHGHAKLDIISAGALVEGPVGKGSFLVAAQRGYLDVILAAIGDATAVPFGKPRNFDYQAIFDHPVGSAATLTTRILGARDEFRLPVGAVEPTLSSEFHRVDLVYRKRLHTWDFLLAPAVRLDRGGFAGGSALSRRSDTVGLFRAELTARPGARFAVTFGADTQLDGYRSVTRQQIFYTPEEPPPDRDTRGFASTSGVYATADLSLGRVIIAPGVRASAFTGPAGSRVFAVDPRLVARWTPHERVALTVGAGLYSQPAVYARSAFESTVPGLGFPEWAEQSSDAILYPSGDGILVIPGAVRYLDLRLGLDPNSPIGLTRAVQVSGGLHVDLPGALGLDGTAFFRGVRDGYARAIEASSYSYDEVPPNTGSLAYGVEVLLRRDLTRRIHGWISYTWMHADRGVWVQRALTERAPGAFDQRHNLVFVLQLRLPHRWELGGRFRVVSGLPYTPIIGGLAFVEGNTRYAPIYGDFNSAHMPVFHQLDLRVDKTWVLRRSIIAAYLDVQNVYNRQNPETLRYAEPYTSVSAVYGVPILPVIGVQVRY